MRFNVRNAAQLLAILFLLLVAGCTTSIGGRGPIDEMGEDAEHQTPVEVTDLEDAPFLGKVRRTAKTTLITDIPTYFSITAVIGLTAPKVGRSTPRTGVEFNMASISGFLYAYNLPRDNDFHLLIGDTAIYTPGVTNVINVEVSGLAGPDAAALQDVRVAFMKLMNVTSMPRSTYTCVAALFPIKVTGGVFYDIQHPKGVGTKRCGGVAIKTTNGWEIHPATTVQ